MLTLIGKVSIGKGFRILSQATWEACARRRPEFKVNQLHLAILAGLELVAHCGRPRLIQFGTGLSKSSRAREIPLHDGQERLTAQAGNV